jgi:hypothetical protein
MRLAHSTIVRSLITLVITGCGAGSGLTGIAIGGGGGGLRAADVLAFFVQPNTAIAGQVISPAVQVAARDSLGNSDTAFTGSVSIALASNSTGAALSGTTTVRAVSGIASFTNLAIDKPGSYTLIATSGSSSATSSAFTVTTRTGP